jgi:hypothetical protein
VGTVSRNLDGIKERKVPGRRMEGGQEPQPVELREGEDRALSALWRRVNKGSARLSPRDQQSVRDAIANSVLEGHQPTPDAVTLLIEFAAGDLTAEQYKQCVLDQAGVRHEIDETR